jgi:hypothetical protein
MWMLVVMTTSVSIRPRSSTLNGTALPVGEAGDAEGLAEYTLGHWRRR